MGDQIALLEDERISELERLEAFEAFFTPIPIAMQICEKALRGAFNLARGDGRKLRVLDPSAGGGSYALALRRLFGADVEITSVEPREEEKRNLKRLSDRVFVGTFVDFINASDERFDAVVTNPPFSLAYEFVRLAFEYNVTKDLVCLLCLSSLGQSSEGAANFSKFCPMEQARVTGRIGFRGPGLNPKNGKKWGVDQRDYSHWLWRGRGETKSPAWLTYNLPELPTSDRTWVVKPGMEKV